MSSVLKGTGMEILAASIKSPEEAAASIQAGADHLTLPLAMLQVAMLQAIATHELSHQTVADFAAGGVGFKI
jgi:transaldolase